MMQERNAQRMDRDCMKVAVLSDTHNLLRPQVAALLGTCDAVIHAGDIGSLQLMDAVREAAGTEVASGVLKAIGGKANVSSVDYCATRLRFTIKDYTQVDEKAVKAAGAAGVIRPDKTTCQVIIGTKVQFVYDELKKML